MNAQLPTNIEIGSARFPATYEQAKAALASCQKIDECKDWANKAEALASYAKMAQDCMHRIRPVATGDRHVSSVPSAVLTGRKRAWRYRPLLALHRAPRFNGGIPRLVQRRRRRNG
jgi:hypothetical protein